MNVGPTEPMTDELKELGEEAYKTARKQASGVAPLNDGQLLQIAFIVNALIDKAMAKMTEAIEKAAR